MITGRFTDNGCNADLLSPLSLAFIGDTVFDLYVRETLVCQADRSTKKLHAQAVKEVSAAAQSRKARELLPSLSEKELAVFKRGRNCHTNHVPKNASDADYHYATGLEALIGWLYLSEDFERLHQIMSFCLNESGEEEKKS